LAFCFQKYQERRNTMVMLEQSDSLLKLKANASLLRDVIAEDESEEEPVKKTSKKKPKAKKASKKAKPEPALSPTRKPENTDPFQSRSLSNLSKKTSNPKETSDPIMEIETKEDNEDDEVYVISYLANPTESNVETQNIAEEEVTCYSRSPHIWANSPVAVSS
jgi:hypothetical protein